MQRQKSFHNEHATLFLVATPIGNLEDMTFRAINTLKSVDFVYAEDTRVSGKLLKYFDIETPLRMYHDFNKEMKSEEILEHLRNGNNIALISDAGYPLISDPGYYVIREAIKEDFNIVSIPGASAFLGALVSSGIAPHPFTFVGFLPNKESKREQVLKEYQHYPHTIIFYESPNRIQKSILSMYHVLGERDVVIARELTKKFEEIIRGTTISLQDISDIKGEVVVVVSGKQEEDIKVDIPIIDEINQYIEDGMTSKEAIKKVAKSRNMTKNDVYMKYHQ